MKKKPIIIISAISVMLFSACVSTKKYEAAVADSDKLKKENTDLKSQNATLSKQTADLNASYSNYKKECDESKTKLMAVQNILAEEQKTMDIVEKRLLDALMNFSNKGVEVHHKDGLLFVTLSEGLMYKTGSSKLEEEARKALASLASVLNDYPKLKVTVMGNTDDEMFKKGSDNWTLSTERANNVIRILRDDYKVDPSRLTSAGKGRYAPVADNTTPEGRAKNRRTEIILNPDLDRIWQEAEMSKTK